jgi:hypothetical protein
MDNYVAALFLPHTDMNQFPWFYALGKRRAISAETALSM